jgi:SAM-dependent methyltransferase
MPLAGRQLPGVSGTPTDRPLAASHGEPSYVWQAGQERRLAMVMDTAPWSSSRRVLEVGCGVGLYLQRLAEHAASTVGVEFEPDRARRARSVNPTAAVVNAANEALPFPDRSFDLVLTNEVIEHVADDRRSAEELVRVLRPGGRIVLFCPNRWYPVETHGIYWRGQYRFGNIPLVNYLPDPLRNHLAPHVRTYTARSLRALFDGLEVREVSHTRIFGAYDNIIRRFGARGVMLRRLLQGAEHTPLNVLGLSHLLVLERTGDAEEVHADPDPVSAVPITLTKGPRS